MERVSQLKLQSVLEHTEEETLRIGKKSY